MEKVNQNEAGMVYQVMLFDTKTEYRLLVGNAIFTEKDAAEQEFLRIRNLIADEGIWEDGNYFVGTYEHDLLLNSMPLNDKICFSRK